MSKPAKYNSTQVTEALTAMVVAGGDPGQGELATGIPADTLRRWKRDTYHAQYREIEERWGRELEEQLVYHARINAQRAAQIEAELLEKAAALHSRDVPQALRAVTDAKTKNIDKLLSLTGRPTAITETRDVASILEGLARMKIVKVVDSTADEDPS